MPSSLHLSAAELRSLVTDGDIGEILELLLDHPALLPIFLHFSSICRTLRRLEHMHREMRSDLDAVFEDMTHKDFDDAFTFFITRKRQERQHAQPPSYRTAVSSTSPSTSLPNSSSQSHVPSQPALPDPNVNVTSLPTPNPSTSSTVDERRDTPIPRVGILQRGPRHFTQVVCPLCRHLGHTYDDCIWQNGTLGSNDGDSA
jgi:hypothetical protein